MNSPRSLTILEIESWAVIAAIDRSDQQLPDPVRDEAGKEYEQHLVELAQRLHIDAIHRGLQDAHAMGDPWRQLLYRDLSRHYS